MFSRAVIRALLAGVSFTTISVGVEAQVAPQSDQPLDLPSDQTSEQPRALDRVIVTGSRVQRDGFEAPTPVTVLTTEDLEARSPSNVADGLNTLPQFQNSVSNLKASTFSAVGNPQGNYLNLRGLGTNRSLILLDGVRVAPTNATGSVDINTLPQALIERVDVITGGASAAYGSDAIVGVVNFVLDTDFTGLKGTLQGSTSYKGDNNAYKAVIAAGAPFAGGAGHLLFSAEHFELDGLQQRDRDGGSDQILTVGTSGAANPFRLATNARYPNMTFGGLISSGPLANRMFLPDGTLAPFTQGATTGAGSGIVIGGDGAYHPDTQTLLSGLETDQLFARASYDFSDTLRGHVQAGFNQSRNKFDVAAISFTPAQLRIYADNGFLDPAVAAGLGATPSFTFGTLRRDLPLNAVDLLNTNQTIKIGLDGDLNDNWSWDASYVYSDTKQRQNAFESRLPNFYAAVDAIDDGSGNIVCRAAVANPTLYGDCVPINLFGEGNVTPEALAYVRGTSNFEVNNNMQILAANIRGDLFSTWAGPVSVAFGGEVRSQTLNQTSNADPAIPRDFTGVQGAPATALWFIRQNVGIAQGKVDVQEVYAEAVIPLARDLPWAKELDLNAAVRVTDYSTSGTVETWKIGASYRPVDDLRFRATASRDIAAPGLSQLFSGLQSSPSSASTPDPHTNSVGTYLIQTQGNDNLKPEVGSMLVAGFVYTPSQMRGFSASVDVTSLLIEDAIFQQGHGEQITDCEASSGLAPVCDLIIRPLPYTDRSAANFPTIVNQVPQNLSKQYYAGADFELAYRAPVSDFGIGLNGEVAFRAIASYLETNKRKVSPFNPTLDSAGGTFGGDLVTDGFPTWTGSVSATYTDGPLSVSVLERFTGEYERDYFQVFDPELQTAPNVAYTDLNVRYKWGEEQKLESYLAISNLFNEKPPLIPSGQNPGLQYPTNKRTYDVIGTYVTLGLKFRH
jgi:outer membrane receptor protein involved in Fe transport